MPPSACNARGKDAPAGTCQGSLLAITVPLMTLLAIRVYRAGVLLYGQPPTIGLFVRTLRG